MKRTADRRAALMAAGAAAIAVATGTATAQPEGIHGAVKFEGGAAIPAGQVEIYLEDLAIQDSAQRRVAETHVESDGGSKTIAFSFSRPAGSTTSPTLRIVARLERLDGWLVARGSAQFDATSSVSVTLKEAIY